MSDNTDNLSSWLLSPSTQRPIERLNSPSVADGTNCENRDNRENRETRENRVNHRIRFKRRARFLRK